MTGHDAIAPQVRIEPGTLEWEISTDGGTNWTSTGVVAQGPEGNPGVPGRPGSQGETLFSRVDVDDPACVVFTLADGTTTFSVPRSQSSALVFEGLDELTFAFPGDGQEHAFSFTQTDNIAKVGVASALPGGWTVRVDQSAQQVRVSTTAGGELEVLLVATTQDGEAFASYWITLEAENMNVQSAVDALPEGGTLQLKAMTYTVASQIVIPAGKTVEGVEGTVLAVTPENAATDITGVFLQGGTLRGVTVQYVSDRRPGEAWTHVPQGVVFQQTVGGTLENSTVTGFRNGVYANNAPDVFIRGNVIEGNRTGIQFANQVGGEVSGNTIRDNETIGFLLHNAGGGATTGVPVIRNNTFSGNWYADFENRWAAEYVTDLNAGNTFTGETRTLKAAPGAGEPGGDQSFQQPASQTANIVVAVRSNIALSGVTIPTDIAGLAEAVAGAQAGDVVAVAAGTERITDPIVIDKVITVQGAAAHATKIEIEGADLSAFTVGAAAVLDGLYIEKTDKAANGSGLAIVMVTAPGAQIRNCVFEGRYDLEANDAEVVRAVQFNNSLEGVLDGNTFRNVRQPSYVEGPLTIVNNYAEGTRGWVVTQNFTPQLSGNRFGTNAVDIAIITNGQPDQGNYSDDYVMRLHRENGGAHVENQIPGYNSARKDGSTYVHTAI